MAPWPRRLRITASGHPAVRAMHGKTFELTADPDLTERATCIVGVRADLAAVADEPVLAGPVRITLSAGGFADTLTAVANPFAAPAGRVVVRQSDHVDADTLAGLADRGAGDLDRRLLDALRDPRAEITLEVVEAGDRPVDNALLAALPSGTPRPPGTQPADVDGLLDRLEAGDHLALRVERSGLDRFRAEIVRAAAEAGAVVALAPGAWAVPPVLVAAGIATPRHLDAGVLTGNARHETALLALAAGAAVPVVARCDGADLPTVLARLADHLGEAARAAVATDPLTPYRPLVHGTLGDLAADPPDGTVIAVAAPDAPASLPAGVARLVAHLALDGVPARTLVAAITAATGLSRQRSYDLVLQLKAGATTEAVTDRNRG
jgi:hypothetical protein